MRRNSFLAISLTFPKTRRRPAYMRRSPRFELPTRRYRLVLLLFVTIFVLVFVAVPVTILVLPAIAVFSTILMLVSVLASAPM